MNRIPRHNATKRYETRQMVGGITKVALEPRLCMILCRIGKL
jgi:hypothetical protein